MRLRPLLIGGALVINGLANISNVDAGFYEGQITTLNGQLSESGNQSAPLKLNGVFFNLEPLNNYYNGKNVSITVKWNSNSSFSVLSIVEKSQQRVENKTIDLSIETKKIEPKIHIPSEEKGLSIKDKLLRQRGNLKPWSSDEEHQERSSGEKVNDIFGNLSQNKIETVPKTLKEKRIELRKLKQLREPNIDLKLKTFIGSSE